MPPPYFVFRLSVRGRASATLLPRAAAWIFNKPLLPMHLGQIYLICFGAKISNKGQSLTGWIPPGVVRPVLTVMRVLHYSLIGEYFS